MALILGLDLGTNSIGWSLVEDKKKSIIGIGSRIFPMGVVNLGEGEGKEMSKNAGRTENRGKRRQFFRQRFRKKLFLKKLSEHNMCPLDTVDFEEWKTSKKFPEKKLKDWFAKNPYELRQKALNEELELEEIGRIFYHMIQRRGFLSNSRNASSDSEDGTIFKGDSKNGKIGISETLDNIQSSHTLGSYLNDIRPKDFEPFKQGQERIRNRYTSRQMYIDEFEQIWAIQSNFHTELNEGLKAVLGGRKKEGYPLDGILFHQRPLRSQKHLVGNCSFETSKTKSPISAIPFEKFRVFQWINTVEYNGHKLNETERELISKQLFSKEKVKFSMLRKAINKADNQFEFNYKNDDPIVGTHTISQLSNKKLFGKEWFDLSEEEQENIWHILYFFDDKVKLKNYARKNWNFDESKSELISKFNLKQGYANLSRKAITNILPFLEQGYQYDVAVALGGIKNAFGQRWDELKSYDTELLDSNIYEIVRSNVKGGYIEPLKEFLQSEFDLSEKDLKKLYHHSSSIEESELLPQLPVNAEADREIQRIKNPIVVTALFEIRRLVNEIIQEYGLPDKINVELARDLKGSKSARQKTRFEQRRLERENDRVKKLLTEGGIRINHDSLLKYKLWEECNRTCPYTGKSIGIEQLFSGKIQIEHIHPWSRSLNDSFMNKTLCFADENRAKGNKTPFEYYSNIGDQKWETIKAQALACFKTKKEYPNAYRKFKHFVKQKHDDDFTSRQLNDTRYISKEAKNYLSRICADITVSPGQVTAHLRHKWGLNNILNAENTKTREDHRHHAVDALVIACTKRSHLQELAKWNSYKDRASELKDFPMPWQNFRTDAEKAVSAVLVSHRKVNPVVTTRTFRTEKQGTEHKNLGVSARGQLHKETVFGKRQAPDSEVAFHVRKPIESLTTQKQIEKVVDPAIRKLITKRVESIGGFDTKGNIPKNAFFEIDDRGNSVPSVFLPNRNGEPVPIRKVRMKETINGAEPLRKDINQYVNPRNNHHVLVYVDEEGNMKEEVVSFWTAVKRKKEKQPIYQLPKDGIEIITTLEASDVFLLGLKETEIDWGNVDYPVLSGHLYRVQKLSSKDYYFRHHKASTIINKDEEIRVKSLRRFKELTPIKVKVTPSGKVVQY